MDKDKKKTSFDDFKKVHEHPEIEDHVHPSDGPPLKENGVSKVKKRSSKTKTVTIGKPSRKKP